MILLRSIALFAAITLSATLSPASTITYNLSNATTTFSDGSSSHGTLTGTIAVDTATDHITSANLIFNVPGYSSPAFATITSSTVANGISQTYIAGPTSGSQSSRGQLALFFTTASASSGNLALCTSAATCGTAGAQPSFVEMSSVHGDITYDLTGATLSPVAPAPAALTPEPSSLALLGTGILSVAAIMLFGAAKIGLNADSTQLKTPA